ncbi:MAG: hypothetical protein ACM3YE_10945 [Bacteroidota bacterium]
MRRKTWLILLPVLGLFIAAWFVVQYLKITGGPFPQPVPGNRQKAEYSYYRIIDQKTGKLLTHISSMPVSIGDEYVTAENRRYIVTRVKGNTAYAKYVGIVK